MIKHLFLVVLVALPLGTACTDSESNAGTSTKLLDSAKGLASQAQESLGNLRDLDVSLLSTMSPEKLRELGKSAMTAIAAQIEQVKDVASAEKAKGALDPVMEKLAAVKGALAGQLPDTAKINAAIQDLKTRLGANLDVMNALNPVLAKLQGLIGS